MGFLEKFVAKDLNVFIFLSLITILVYSPVFKGDYVFDDDTFIVNNTYVHDLNHVKQIYTHSTTDGSGIGGGNFYRPNQSLSHALVYSLISSKAPAQHALSVLVHLIAVCLLYIFLGLLAFSNMAAFIASAIFAVHPINTEAVSYISGLSDPLCLVFILCACISYIQFKKQGKPYYLVFVFLSSVLALFTKESAVMLVAVLLFIELYLQPKKIKIVSKEKLILGLLFLLCGGFLYLKFTVFNFTGNISLSGADNEYTQSLWVRFITFCTVFPGYMGMLIFPLNQYIEKPYRAYVSFETLGIGGLMLLVAFAYLFFTSIKSNRGLMLSIGIFFAFLLPVSGIIPTNAIYLEHWLYLPFLGFAITIAMLVEKLNLKNGTAITILFCLFLIVYGSKTIYRNTQWADAIKFYKNEIKYNKRSARIYNNLAMVLNNKGDYFSAINYYGMAISIYNAYPQTHHNLAETYLKLNQLSNAIAEEYKALELQPNFIYSLQSLFDIYTALKDQKRAEAFSGFIKQAEDGQMPDWNAIKSNLAADTKK
jgi:hypothetical protein